MTLRLGFFTDFKGADTVLLHGTPHDVLALAERLATSPSLSLTPLALHELAIVAPLHSVRLFVGSGTSPTAGDPLWSCSPSELPSIQASLSALAAGCPAHQYFALVNSAAQLIVSVGEYDDEWWRRLS
jgi:hypothetical protein